MRHVAALKVRSQPNVDASVDGRAGGRKVEVARAHVSEHRVGDPAVCAERELRLAAGIKVVVLVEGGVGVTDLLHRLDDVVPHHQDAAVAPGVANEALAARAGHDNRVIEKAGVCHRPKPFWLPLVTTNVEVASEERTTLYEKVLSRALELPSSLNASLSTARLS